MSKQSKTIKLTPTKGRPETPAHITGEALAEWDRVCNELDQMGTLSTADRAAIALYCIAWAKWIEAEKQISATGGAVTLSPVKEQPMHNPWQSVSSNASGQLIKYAKELGLTPWARSKFKVEAEESEDEAFAELDS